jgi:hypothetical protein
MAGEFECSPVRFEEFSSPICVAIAPAQRLGSRYEQHQRQPARQHQRVALYVVNLVIIIFLFAEFFAGSTLLSALDEAFALGQVGRARRGADRLAALGHARKAAMNLAIVRTARRICRDGREQ